MYSNGLHCVLIKRYIVVYSILYHTFRHKTKYIIYVCIYTHTYTHMCVFIHVNMCIYTCVYIYTYAHAVSAFRGKALLGIKCINLFFCACVYYFGEGDSVQLDKDTNSGEKG